MPNPDSENDAVQRYLDSERAERRIVDRRHAERRIERLESPHPTDQWRSEIKSAFDLALEQHDNSNIVLYGALLHIVDQLRCLQERMATQGAIEDIAKLKEEIAALKAIIG